MYIPNFVIPDLLLLLFPFIVIGSRLFCTDRSKAPWRIANIGFILIFVLLNFIPLASGTGRFFISNWHIDDFGVLMREVLMVSAILVLAVVGHLAFVVSLRCFTHLFFNKN